MIYGWKKDFENITILTAIILLIGIFLIAKTVLISKDGISYIDCAKQFEAKPFFTVLKDIPLSPGYPFFIFITHKIIPTFHADSLQRWIISAQVFSLFSKLIACIVFYFIAVLLTSRQAAFWGILILIFLPDSAEYSSDVLSEWPYLMFLSIGFLLLLGGAENKKLYLYGLAGVISGLGYLVRAECCQLIIYGITWFAYTFYKSEKKVADLKVSLGFVLLISGFFLAAGPYMSLKGYVFPEKMLIKIPPVFSKISNPINQANAAFFFPLCKTNGNILVNICETLMYYFVPGAFLGCFYYFKNKGNRLENKFYPAILILFNIVLLSWVSTSYNYLSRRHTLVLIAFTCFFIPIGLEKICEWFDQKIIINKPVSSNSSQRLFYILLALGILICLPKLFKFTSTEKYGYRQAADWLNKNTLPNDVIAVPDKRIAFYAQRKWLEYLDEPRKVNYVVKIGNPTENTNEKEIYTTWVDKKKKKRLTVIHYE